MAELVVLDEERIYTLECIRAQKTKVAQTYDKKIQPNSFKDGELV